MKGRLVTHGHYFPSMCGRPCSWSSRTHRSTWLFCRSTRSTDRLHRLVDDFMTRLDLDDFRSTWSTWWTCGHVDHSFCSCLLTAWQLTQKILCPSTWCLPSSKWKVYWPSFPFLLPQKWPHFVTTKWGQCSLFTNYFGLLLNYNSVTVDEKTNMAYNRSD